MAMRCEIIDELHDELEAVSWQRMVLLATLYKSRDLARRFRHHVFERWEISDEEMRAMEAAVMAPKQVVDEVPK